MKNYEKVNFLVAIALQNYIRTLNNNETCVLNNLDICDIFIDISIHYTFIIASK